MLRTRPEQRKEAKQHALMACAAWTYRMEHAAALLRAKRHSTLSAGTSTGPLACTAVTGRDNFHHSHERPGKSERDGGDDRRSQNTAGTGEGIDSLARDKLWRLGRTYLRRDYSTIHRPVGL